MDNKKEFQKKYSDIKKQLHLMVYGTKEYNTLKNLMNFYYRKGF